MKKWLIISLLLIGCTHPKQTHTIETLYKTDTIFVTDTVYYADTVKIIPQEYLEYKLIVLNVKHYVDITEKRPANKTFFYGWIRRAVDGVPELLTRDKQNNE